MEYPAKVVSKARELYLTKVDGAKKPWRSYETIARLLNAEFSVTLPKKTVHEWSKQFGWVRPDLDGVADGPELPPIGEVGGDRLPKLLGSQTPAPVAVMDWDWEERKAEFIGDMAGLAKACIAVDVNGSLIFKDDESRIKTGLALLEMVGKFQSGKFDKAEAGDKIPALDKGQVNAVINFFMNPGAPTPSLSPRTIDVTPEPTDE